MAEQDDVPGLTIGQLVTLTFGFLAASALIFAFGFWVGYDAAQRRCVQEEQIVRVPVQRPSKPPPTATLLPTFTRRPRPTAPPKPTRTLSFRTPTKGGNTPRSPVRETNRTPTIPRTTPTEAQTEGTVWTVQVRATKDAVQAIMLKRRLRLKGYDAFTVIGHVGGVKWYRVRVGRFRNRVNAKILEIRLREKEGLKDAFLTQQ